MPALAWNGPGRPGGPRPPPAGGADHRVRVTDRNGVVLPARAFAESLPHFQSAMPPGAAGARWDDALVRGAARLADFLRPYQEHLHVREVVAEDGGFVLWTR